MIGAVIKPQETIATREFFELFKTPWHFFQPGEAYDVLLCTTEPPPDHRARLVIVFSSGLTSSRAKPKQVTADHQIIHLVWNGLRIPIYGKACLFPSGGSTQVHEASTGNSMMEISGAGGVTTIRLGYDLFAEVLHLLESGQPASEAEIPTLDHHINLVRSLILRAGLTVIEIPPSPANHPFITCLTHDVDHPIQRNHFGDHTMFGFLRRALLDTPFNAARGRIPLRRVWTNWLAALKLPFVHMGWARDCWCDFDRYLEIESGLGATYFLIPRRDYPGRRKNAPSVSERACRYTLAELRHQIARILSSGQEVGLHGLDTWMDQGAARSERTSVSSVTQTGINGVRMHWLYFDSASFKLLDESGFGYDSTFGYNQTIGYRAGTGQAYQPLTATTLLELPLHIMDTALFYPAYLNLRESEATDRVTKMFSEFEQNGGALTINWHDRSIFPERLWDEFYRGMLDKLMQRKVWFATANQAASWFRFRRKIRFVSVSGSAGNIHLHIEPNNPQPNLPGLKIRIHRPCIAVAPGILADGPVPGYVDTPMQNSPDQQITI
jgi:hypothetical protein